MNSFFYLAPLCIIFFLRLSCKTTNWQGVVLLGFIAKLFFAYLMTYLVITVYGYGDLPTYFVFAKQLSLDRNVEWLPLLSSGYLIALLNSFIFSVLPPSIYGLATLTGLSSFVYSYLLIKAFRPLLNDRWLWIATVVVLFLPVLGTQSGYIGKETYILPLLGYIFFTIGKLQRPTILVGFAVFFIGLIRPYQGITLIASMALAAMISSDSKQRLRMYILGLMLLLVGGALFGGYLSDNLQVVMESGATEFLSTAYSGGNLMLSPYPQPLTILQNFRPFPWEAHNAMALVASFENLIILYFFLQFGVIFVRNVKMREMRATIFDSYLLTFSFAYIVINLIIFSYNSNVGDLARRHIYYYPHIILFGALIMTQKRKLAAEYIPK